MKLNIVCNDGDLLIYFKRYILTPFKVLGIDITPLLEKYTIYIGVDPTPETTFANVNIDKKTIELPFNYTKIFGKEKRYVYKDAYDGVHEIGHVIHFEKLKDVNQWNKWGIDTNNKVCLDYVNPAVQVPSYEKFAWDVAELFNFNLKQWYIDFLGGKKGFDYYIANAAHVLSQSHLMNTDATMDIREKILDKYVDKV